MKRSSRRLVPSLAERDALLAAKYDAVSAPLERRFLASSRPWIGGRAAGNVLEVAVGTGANLPHYRPDVRLTALELSPGMLGEARKRARTLGLAVDFVQGDAQHLPFDDGAFEAVISTFALCGVVDERLAIQEMVRVLRPGGSLLLADHIVASNPLLRAAQRVLESVTIRTSNEHFTRRPLLIVRELGLQIVSTERLHFGAIERLHAVRP